MAAVPAESDSDDSMDEFMNNFKTGGYTGAFNKDTWEQVRKWNVC